MDTVIFIVAHPDDMAYGVGGTAMLLKEQYRLHVLCATRGERGTTLPMVETAAIREKEEIAACSLLDAELTFLNMIDREVFAGKEICTEVAGILKEEQAKAVFTIWPIDSHPDHSGISEITKKAVWLAGIETEFYFMEESLPSQTSHFNPDIFVDISAVMEQKLELIRCHKCQNSGGRMAEAALRQFSFRACQMGNGAGYAEGFKTIRPMTNSTESILFGL